MKRVAYVLSLMPVVALAAGCSLAPKSFRDMAHTAPIVRARAVGLGDKQSAAVSVPAMIERLDDSDCVVRMAANDGLKTRTGKDFGFVPWGGAEERAEATSRWKAWWSGQGQSVSPSPQSSAKVATRNVRARRRRGRAEAQGGATTTWTMNPSPQSAP
ncbi:hypothetical protein TA3x_005100 [Tundrisphaera sp. TA3]|uniref:hypothetical protein n=1 Tax=Tundrisphaera sp. TA3 TaxID=3435775 RepID=UPI003EBE892E